MSNWVSNEEGGWPEGLDPTSYIEVTLRDGEVNSAKAQNYEWINLGEGYDIIKWRLI